MVKTFDSKIKELEIEKSELDLTFLQLKKQEYQDRMYEILDSQNDELDESSAISELNKIKSYRKQIKDIDEKIQNNSNFLVEIDKKIAYYGEKREELRNMPFYKDTIQWIDEIFWDCELYQYAKENGNEELVGKLEKRSLTLEEYSLFSEKMFKEVFVSVLRKKNKKPGIQQAPKVVILLPEGMSEQINEELGKNRDINAKEVEDFLKKELKKNGWEIKVSHIKNKFKDKSNYAVKYIKKLIINYPWFVIIDNENNDVSIAPNQSKREKLISSILSDTSEQKDVREKQGVLLKKLASISEMQNLEVRISGYLDLFEESGCKFTDREEFAENLSEVISTYTHIQIEKEIQKILTNIIQDSLYPFKTEKFWYLAYKFSRSCDNWRIVLYPNWEIFKVCSHGDYEKVINTQPSVNKK